MKTELKRIDVLRAGVVQGIIGAGIGLLVMPFMMLAALAGNAALAGVVMAILLPILYAIGGFLAGIISAFIYNLVAKSFGGLLLEFSTPAGVVPTSGPDSGVISG